MEEYNDEDAVRILKQIEDSSDEDASNDVAIEELKEDSLHDVAIEELEEDSLHDVRELEEESNDVMESADQSDPASPEINSLVQQVAHASSSMMTSPPRQTGSKVHCAFVEMLGSDGCILQGQKKCVLCGDVVQCKSANTTNLWSHLKKWHPIKHRELLANKKKPEAGAIRKRKSSDNAESSSVMVTPEERTSSAESNLNMPSTHQQHESTARKTLIGCRSTQPTILEAMRLSSVKGKKLENLVWKFLVKEEKANLELIESKHFQAILKAECYYKGSFDLKNLKALIVQKAAALKESFLLVVKGVPKLSLLLSVAYTDPLSSDLFIVVGVAFCTPKFEMQHAVLEVKQLPAAFDDISVTDTVNEFMQNHQLLWANIICICIPADQRFREGAKSSLPAGMAIPIVTCFFEEMEHVTEHVLDVMERNALVAKSKLVYDYLRSKDGKELFNALLLTPMMEKTKSRMTAPFLRDLNKAEVVVDLAENIHSALFKVSTPNLPETLTSSDLQILREFMRLKNWLSEAVAEIGSRTVLHCSELMNYKDSFVAGVEKKVGATTAAGREIESRFISYVERKTLQSGLQFLTNCAHLDARMKNSTNFEHDREHSAIQMLEECFNVTKQQVKTNSAVKEDRASKVQRLLERQTAKFRGQQQKSPFGMSHEVRTYMNFDGPDPEAPFNEFWLKNGEDKRFAPLKNAAVQHFAAVGLSNLNPKHVITSGGDDIKDAIVFLRHLPEKYFDL